MKNVIIVRYGELFLKGDNRGYFENVLIANIKRTLNGLDFVFTRGQGRYIISDFSDSSAIIDRLSNVFGVHSVSIARLVEAKPEILIEQAVAASDNKGSFKVVTHRADKRFGMTSPELNREAGASILSAYPNLKVDVHNPDFIVNIDIREDGTAFVYRDSIKGLGGMPVGCAGSGLLMLSGGIDSPVAGFLMAGRGLKINAVHFHSFPYTSERALEKVKDLAKTLTTFCGRIDLNVVGFTQIQETLHKNIDPAYNIILMRRMMMRIATEIASKNGDGAIITGESLSQVASQTLASITATNISSLPILRPLIGLDKNKIIEYAQKINTYELSIQPFEDCCTVFLPKHPATRPNLETITRLESTLPIESLINHALENTETLTIKR